MFIHKVNKNKFSRGIRTVCGNNINHNINDKFDSWYQSFIIKCALVGSICYTIHEYIHDGKMINEKHGTSGLFVHLLSNMLIGAGVGGFIGIFGMPLIPLAIVSTPVYIRVKYYE